MAAAVDRDGRGAPGGLLWQAVENFAGAFQAMRDTAGCGTDVSGRFHTAGYPGQAIMETRTAHPIRCAVL